MIIKSVNLVNFRNHVSYHLECNKDTTLILGENGCGKTSVLEAIYILTRGKSFRATDSDIVKRGTDFYRIDLEYDTGEVCSAAYDGKVKTFTVLDKKTRRLPKKQKYPVILFLPSDLNLISGSPSRHRDYFDRIFSELSDDYSGTISKYEKALRQRNELLKSETLTNLDLFSWNLLLARFGSSIGKFRAEYTAKINQTLGNTYYSIAENHDSVSLAYHTDSLNYTEDQYLKQLELNYDRDRYLGHTTFGIHKDDYEFIFNQNSADGSASRGETRSIILALKFVEADIITNTLHYKPIVLLDDVFSELDETRRRCLVKNFKDHQVIITSVEDIKL